MFRNSEDALIEAILREQGLSEDDCLCGLTEQQVRVWVRYAVCLEPVEQIKRELFGHRKSVSDSVVMYTLAEASLRILANVLKDADLVYELGDKPQARKRVQSLIKRVEEMRSKKGAKIRCRELK